ncbi:PREDICTED: serine-aspartate repeat-containing protein I isoform X2 [Drosophila arizonae]|uniref:Serine-aspartate repeat-containing protein I isoform X2 n=1 Tax=Drosophila arizonae TaxID=7263 RepID=A0ABM1PNC4_DROAR|nr:PREDICTED: serine-aspartate repeat-containing protein I isoform X2 [Drosophila arizonae]
MSDTLAVMPMNGQAAGQNGRKQRSNDDFSVKLSTIRIWMHEKDIGKLTRILWAGQGQRLCQQASNNGRVKRFLAAVPHVMNATKDLHQAVIDNNLESLQMQLEPPVPPALVTAKDSNGLNVIHKAAGLGHTKMLEYLVGLWPEGAHEVDITGKTPLHWAASAKNNMRCYTLLTQAGCDEEAQDYKMKTPSYYRHKPHEIERAFLVYVPEAPRISPDSVTDWEALSDDNDSNAGGDASRSSSKQKLSSKPAAIENGRKSLDDSAENTSELDTNDGTSAIEDDELSKAEADVNGVAAADADADVDANINADVDANASSPVPQRRPETPAAFATGNGNDTAGDTESEAENIAGAVSAEGAEVEAEAAEPAMDGDEAETSVEPIENGVMDDAVGAESEQNANEKTEAIVNENEAEAEMEIEAETEEQQQQKQEIETAEVHKEKEEDKEEKATSAAAAAAAEEEEVEEDDDEVQIGLL